MHGVVLDNLEEYLADALAPADRQVIEAHLGTCKGCREEVQGMQEMSLMFGSLRSEEVFDPSPGFYAGIRRKVDEQAAVPAIPGFFGFDFAFGRRLVFASLLTLAALGSYLVSTEMQYQAGPSPEAIMAEQESPNFDAAPASDNMLVTLTAYEQH